MIADEAGKVHGDQASHVKVLLFYTETHVEWRVYLKERKDMVIFCFF